jgi:hypothetical protein
MAEGQRERLESEEGDAVTGRHTCLDELLDVDFLRTGDGGTDRRSAEGCAGG